jgi:hypothetical protein
VATTYPNEVDGVVFSEPMPSGAYAGWRLVQWTREESGCATVAVGIERKAGEAQETLVVLGPKVFFGADDVTAPTMADFLKAPGARREFSSLGLGTLPRWEEQGL